MQIPLQVVFRNLEPSAAIESAVLEHTSKLEDFGARITGCRVVVGAEHRRHRRGKLYHVRIDLAVPGAELAVTRDPELDHAHEDVYVAMRDAFDAARRRVQSQMRRVRGSTKAHGEMPRGRVTRLFVPEGYGFIGTDDGREVYFHCSAVLRDAFARLEPGAEVCFAEELGERGPRASTVKLTHKQRFAAP